ncbi:MAG: hypothetical protein KF889_22140 [Alphaproteobacteria bacterium]|nr:hypothetical protein [Alphaproteobacteria bacterium]MCW5743549.1 hypothetical protein [Alphaproteobacteria bacterium]
MTLRRRSLLVLSGAALASPAAAHHGWSSYDAGKTLTLKGAILESKYQNPHGEIVVEVERKKWTAILAPVSRMQSRGLPREELAVGKVVTLVGYASRVHDGEMRAERITTEGGKTVELR